VSRSRMFDNDDPSKIAPSTRSIASGDLSNEIPSPRTTIVGGRPPESDAMLPAVPVGIQELLRLACVDETFRRELLHRRIEVAAAAGISLTRNEQSILNAVSAQQLEAMIDGLPPPPVDRRTFLRETATAAVLLLGGASVAACERKKASPRQSPERFEETLMPVDGGAAPDLPPERPTDNEMKMIGGAAPDRPDATSMPVSGGAAPDFPPERPTENEMKTKGGAAPTRPHKNAVTRGIRPDVLTKKSKRK